MKTIRDKIINQIRNNNYSLDWNPLCNQVHAQIRYRVQLKIDYQIWNNIHSQINNQVKLPIIAAISI